MSQTIKETKEAIEFLTSVAKSIEDANSDGKISWSETLKMVSLFPSLTRALDGYDKIPKGLLDIDSSEAQEIITMIRSIFDDKITSSKGRAITDKSITVLLALNDLISEIRGINPPKAEIVE